MYEQEVRRGAEVLDKMFVPGWEKDVDLSILDLSEPLRCVGGQLSGSFLSFVSNFPRDERGDTKLAGHGFIVDSIAIEGLSNKSVEKEYIHLTNAWIEEITQRLRTVQFKEDLDKFGVEELIEAYSCEVEANLIGRSLD